MTAVVVLTESRDDDTAVDSTPLTATIEAIDTATPDGVAVETVEWLFPRSTGPIPTAETETPDPLDPGPYPEPTGTW